MKTMTRTLAVAAVAVLAVALSAPAGATCGTNAIISTIASDGVSYIIGTEFQQHPSYGVGGIGPYTYSYDVANQAPMPLTAAASISFWGLGTGDPALGVGNDNGGFDMAGDPSSVYAFGYAAGDYAGDPTLSFWYGALINSSWDAGATDNCPGPNVCTCLLLTDENVVGGATTGVFAITGGLGTANIDTFMNNDGTSDGQGHNAPIVLVPVPAPTIVGSSRNPTTNDVTLSINVGPSSQGDYSQDGCACGATAYRVLQAIVPRGGMPPASSDLGAWSPINQADGMPQPAGGTALGTQLDVTSNCGASDSDVYLTTQLVFDSGFATSRVSGSSLRVECGPNLAAPADTRPGRPDRPGQDRQRGRRR